MNTVLPAFLKPFLWSYDLSSVNLERDKRIIIKQVLEYGTMQAVEWLRSTYSEAEIYAAIRAVPTSDWSKKSLALWSLLYKVTPAHRERALP